MKLWIDDVRPAPGGWIWAKTSDAALQIFLNGDISEISFDHDLGGDDTSMRVATLIEMRAFSGIAPPIWHIHSANPVGRNNLKAALEKADSLYFMSSSQI